MNKKILYLIDKFAEKGHNIFYCKEEHYLDKKVHTIHFFEHYVGTTVVESFEEKSEEKAISRLTSALAELLL